MRQGDKEMGRGGEGGKGRGGANGTFPLFPFLPFSLSPLLLFFVLALAAFLRFYALDASSLWSDEGNTWALIQRSFGYIASAAAADIHPPGYYWLLSLWSTIFGTSAYAMRSFSAICGILLVWVIYQIALEIRNTKYALVAALLAAVNPFQIYYSQEARMYMLLALESAGLMWAVLAMGRGRDEGIGRWGVVGVYAICASAGLWTHYSFPIVLLAAGIFWVFWILDFGFWRRATDFQNSKFKIQKILDFGFANLIALLLFMPWLPTALIRVFAWPNQGSAKTFAEAATVVAHTLWFGPLATEGWLATAALALTIVLPLLSIWRLRRDRRSWLLILWLTLPIGLMLGAGLFRDAYLKFLLVASPAWSLLVAGAGGGEVGRWGNWVKGGYLLRTTHYALLAILALASFPALQVYYSNPTARDNYQGVARYLDAVGDPQRTLVILDAPGQSDVWGYYNSPACYSAIFEGADITCSEHFRTVALPQQRPPDEAQTIATLENATRDRQQIFALFWAMDEADPQQIVERWLDTHAFKGLNQWQGNLRFVTYALPSNLECQVFPSPIRFGDAIELTQLCQPQLEQQLFPGAAAIVGLRWQSSTKLDRRYKVSLQLLDSRNQLIAQRDSEPGGGSQPTSDWQPGQTVIDNHGLVIPAGVPPGNYRLIVALYDAESGQRLPAGSSDFAEIGSVTVVRPPKAIPVEIVPIQHRVNYRFASGLTLVGYDLYERGFAHDPTKPINSGATAHLTLYWQAPSVFPPNWSTDQQFMLQWGNQSISAPLAGGNHPTMAWQPDEFVRGEFEIIYDGSGQAAELLLGTERLQLR